ncbi:hypothetical protein U6N30_12340 [Blastococcus brunescens]|uniref:MgsA AAA+ ATPase C-terminal domain-containing protein n=2 Tax=Blastococcus brunescens TaxID=1564165 RepID=A0ABZ1B814_9ACTN|nr:hypothetical protein [Blastococcus sp. BMG 8361]WRL66958.1 hypothetical protein U6N30_12340 [Blastococcus sp. BMG 8361]
MVEAGRTRGSSPAGWSSRPARTSAWPTRRRCSPRSRPPTRWPSSGCPRATSAGAGGGAPGDGAQVECRHGGHGESVADVRAGQAGPVPPGLRDGHYAGAKKLGNAQTYVYPHAHPDGVVPQQYPPDALVGKDYYRPTSRGAEARLGERLAKLRAIIRRGR